MTAFASQHDMSILTDRPPDAREVDARTFSQLRTTLIRALRASPEAREPICDALELVEAIQLKLEDDKPAPTKPANEPAKKRGGREYAIRSTAEGEFLVEHRPGHSQPFRCPRSSYDAAAEVLCHAEDALHFDQILDLINARLGERQPDYRLRVSLRFWMSRKAVARFRTRYKAVDQREFPGIARALWEELRAGADEDMKQ